MGHGAHRSRMITTLGDRQCSCDSAPKSSRAVKESIREPPNPSPAPSWHPWGKCVETPTSGRVRTGLAFQHETVGIASPDGGDTSFWYVRVGQLVLLVPLGAPPTPARGNAAHVAIPMAVKFGGSSPPHPIRRHGTRDQEGVFGPVAGRHEGDVTCQEFRMGSLCVGFFWGVLCAALTVLHKRHSSGMCFPRHVSCSRCRRTAPLPRPLGRPSISGGK